MTTHHDLVSRIRGVAKRTKLHARLPKPVEGPYVDRRSKAWLNQPEIAAGVYEVTAAPLTLDRMTIPDAFEVRIRRRNDLSEITVWLRNGVVTRTHPPDKHGREDLWGPFFESLALSDTGRDFVETQGIGDHYLSAVIGQLIDNGKLSREDLAAACEEMRAKWDAEEG